MHVNTKCTITLETFLFRTRDVHFRQKMQSVIAQKPILTLQVESLAS